MTGLVAALVQQGADGARQVTAAAFAPDVHPFDDASLLSAVSALGAVTAPTRLGAGQIGNLHYQAGVILPLPANAWVLVLTAQPAEDHPAAAQPYLQQLTTLLEHQRLRESQQIAEAVQDLMQLVGQNLSPQAFLNIIQDRFWSADVALCALMFYGPQQEDRPHGPFDYVELRGTWSRRFGSGAGLGLRLYLERYTDLLSRLDQQGIVIFQPSDLAGSIDPLVRAFLQFGRIRRVVFISLYSGARRVGIFALGTTRRRDFTAHEIQLYQTISRFTSLNAVADVLRQEHDFVQRARAALLESVTDGVMMTLPPSLERSAPSVLTINESFTRMFNVSAAAAQGLSLDHLLDRMQLRGDVRASLKGEWSRISVRDPATQSSTFAMTHPDGYAADIEWYSAPVYSNQQVIGRIYTFHDASESKAAARMRAEFIGRMSHELRTPLTSIQGFAELSANLIETGSAASAREYLGIILQSTRHMNNLITRIIEVTRADMGELQLMPIDTRIHLLVADVCRIHAEALRARQQLLTCDVPADLPAVLVDPPRFIEVLAILVDNAIRHSPRDSTIHISAFAARSPSDLPPGAPPEVVTPALVVMLADEGPGLTPADAGHVFLPFYRTSETRAAQVPGVGLGLTLARGLVEAHRGKLWAEARRRGRKGARFLFTLPLAGE